MLPAVRNSIWAGGIVAIAGIGAIVGWNRPQWPEQTEYQGRPIPEDGLVLNPKGTLHAGNPSEAEKDLKVIYRGLKAYIAKHGKFPMPGELAGSDEHPGLIARGAFKLPDAEYSDYAAQDVNSTYAFAYRAPRHDLKPKPVNPTPDERDVWMYTDVYVRRNDKVFRDGTKETQPTGVYVVLWSDGEVEQVHPLDIVWTGIEGDRIMRFPGEPGTDQNAVGERERIRKANGIRLVESG